MTFQRIVPAEGLAATWVITSKLFNGCFLNVNFVMRCLGKVRLGKGLTAHVLLVLRFFINYYLSN